MALSSRARGTLHRSVTLKLIMSYFHLTFFALLLCAEFHDFYTWNLTADVRVLAHDFLSKCLKTFCCCALLAIQSAGAGAVGWF